MTQPSEISRAFAKTIHDLAKNLLSLSEIIEKGQAGAVFDSKVAVTGSDSEEEDKKPKKKKKEEKDPNAPKRNLSSYMLYSQEVRPATVRENPELKAVDVAKLIGSKWNALSEKEKAPYVKQAEKEKERFDKENARYKSSIPGSAEATTTSSSSSSSKRKTPSDSEQKKKSKKESSDSKKETEQPKKKSKKKN